MPPRRFRCTGRARASTSARGASFVATPGTPGVTTPSLNKVSFLDLDRMDTQRLIALIIFTFSGFLLWTGWQKHNAPPAPAPAAAVVAAATGTAPTLAPAPVAPGTAPAAGASPQAIPGTAPLPADKRIS